MNVDAIGAIQPLESAGMSRPERLAPSATHGSSFTEWMQGEVAEVDGQIAQAEQATRALAAGDDQALHTTILSLERARSSFEFVVQVRNRLLEAYQDLLRMQI